MNIINNIGCPGKRNSEFNACFVYKLSVKFAFFIVLFGASVSTGLSQTTEPTISVQLSDQSQSVKPKRKKIATGFDQAKSTDVPAEKSVGQTAENQNTDQPPGSAVETTAAGSDNQKIPDTQTVVPETSKIAVTDKSNSNIENPLNDNENIVLKRKTVVVFDNWDPARKKAEAEAAQAVAQAAIDAANNPVTPVSPVKTNSKDSQFNSDQDYYNSPRLASDGYLPRAETKITDNIARLIVRIASQENLPPLLVLELMRQESKFNSRVCSGKSACGLMQMIPGTAERFGISAADRMVPEKVIKAGCQYITFLWKKFSGRPNHLALVLAGYNAGEGAVMKYGYNVPPYKETQDYVRIILGNYKRAQELLAVYAIGTQPAKQDRNTNKKVLDTMANETLTVNVWRDAAGAPAASESESYVEQTVQVRGGKKKN